MCTHVLNNRTLWYMIIRISSRQKLLKIADTQAGSRNINYFKLCTQLNLQLVSYVSIINAIITLLWLDVMTCSLYVLHDIMMFIVRDDS